MLVVWVTPVAICSDALMDIEARPRQCVNTMIIDTQARFRMTFAIGQFRYIKIQLKTIDITTRLQGINPTNS